MSSSQNPPGAPGEDSILPQTRQLEAFSRKVTATASHLIGPLDSTGVNVHYQSALGELHRELRRPMVQRSIFNFARNSPRELVRTLSTNEIQHRTLAHLPDELLANIPEPKSSYSLFQGFQATQPEEEVVKKKKHGRHASRGRKLLAEDERKLQNGAGPPELNDLKNEKLSLAHRLEMMGIRKSMCSSEIREIDTKISNLNTMRKIVLDRLGSLEQEEMDLEQELLSVDNRLEDLQEELEDAAALAKPSPTQTESEDGSVASGFMSESIYEKLPSPKTKRKKVNRRTTMPILHEHMDPGSRIREFQAHTDMITAMDFDYPFGTMVTAALDDTVRVWDLNAGRCMGMLDGHLSSVRCLQVEEEIVATGSMDASIRLWDLSRAQYAPQDHGSKINKQADEEDADEDDDGLTFQNEGDEPPPPHPNSMADCPLFKLEAHVAEVTALHFRGNTLVSGSADKTLRQWDLEKGRCVQTLDVLWAAAQASATSGIPSSAATSGGRGPRDASADFVGALQCFDAALACGTADGMVRLWDLRSGQVHRSLVGHTGPVTCLQFDDMHLVTGSLDRSIRIWDLRMGSIHDAFAYDAPITSLQFDTRRIVAAAGEPVVKVYDKADGRRWNVGSGAGSGENGDPVVWEDEFHQRLSVVERVRVKDGFLVEGRRDGTVGLWSC
ncbi:Mitochondrial fission protein [Venturia inaequalis]|uniref:Mitochondrial division protein 1 n=1 Tax=Venturia inaequalis TaxID=5025 RepID=A0A8H3UIH9_VENIN|nr:Mitochondrial fission protein [Venturia inaequalis]